MEAIAERKQQLERLETKVCDALAKLRTELQIPHQPITDGVVNIDAYLACSPKILWILKEPWEVFEDGELGTGWSASKVLSCEVVRSNTGSYPIMAYVTFSVFHGFPGWNDIPYATEDVRVAHALRRVAYINVSKWPGPKQSSGAAIALAYEHHRAILSMQVNGFAPDVLIGGSTLQLFYSDLGLTSEMFNKERSAWFCRHEGRLYIDAYHPSQRATVPKETYVNDIVSIIRMYFPDAN